jgi:hypothetical protein
VRNRIILGTALSAIAVVGMAAPASAHTAATDHKETKTATLSVLHAVPGVPVDVYVDGKLTLDNFQPGTLSDALTLPRGDYTVAITADTATNDSDPIIGPFDINLHTGKNYTAVAYLDVDGDPAATLFRNKVTGYKDGKGRLTVRHVAAAPDVDILAGGTAVIDDLDNPSQSSLLLAPGTVSASVALAGTTAPVIGPADVTISANTTTIVYAWGSAKDGTLALAVQTVTP